MKVTYINRDKRRGNYSIETLFQTIQDQLKSKIEIESYFVPSFKEQLKGIYQVSKLRSDVFHLTGDANYLALGLPKRKTILTIHDLGSLDNNKGLRKFLLKTWFFSIPLKRVKYITTISEFTKKRVLEYFSLPPEKVKVIYNCISPTFHFVPKEFSSKVFKILIVGTAPNKNIEGIIQAVGGLNVELTFIGKLSEDHISTMRHNNTPFVNHLNLSTEQIFEKYKECDMLYFASWYEGFGLPIIEANVVGRPVLTSNRCSMPEVAGNAACIVDPSNPKEIKDGVIKIMNNSEYKNQLIKNGLINAERFSIHTISDQYLTIYKELNSK